MERKERNGNTQRLKILQACGRHFIEEGYNETSLRKIAGELDISLGLISYYFPSKRDIAKELFSEQLRKFSDLASEYTDEDDPLLKSAVLIKLQNTIMMSPRFMNFYMDALKEDIILTVICDSGIETYKRINDKYDLGLSDDYLTVYGNLISASVERSLILYAEDLHLTDTVSNLVFMTMMGRFYGHEDVLKEKCQESDLIVARIIVDHPELLQSWL